MFGQAHLECYWAEFLKSIRRCWLAHVQSRVKMRVPLLSSENGESWRGGPIPFSPMKWNDRKECGRATWAPSQRRANSNPTSFLVVFYVSAVLVFRTWRKQPLLRFLLPRMIRIGERTSWWKDHLRSPESCSPSLPMASCRSISQTFRFCWFWPNLKIFLSCLILIPITYLWVL